jgi:phosphinothricin acetyltransferase
MAPETTDPVIRPACVDDLPGILAIYNDAVLNTVAIFNDDTVDLADRRAWFEARAAAGFPILVAADGAGGVLGYASYGPFRPQQGFRHAAELSVYVAADARGRGIGDRLMTALVEEATRRGICVLIGGIEGENAASIRLHRRHGFEETGRMPAVAVKFGRWLDLVFMQRRLADRPPV